MSQSIDLGNTEVINFNGNKVAVLQLNGNEIWRGVGLDLNYTGLDVNGNVEGSLEFDGTIVAYGVGKPTITYYKEVTPTPTTEEGYYGYYISGSVPYKLVDSSNFSSLSITVGETVCYEITEDISMASKVLTEYKYCNGYNSDYYGGYQFHIRDNLEVRPNPENYRIVPEILEIPNTHKGLPVTKILKNSFCCDDEPFSEGGRYTIRYYTQSYNIKDIVFGKNIKEIQEDAFSGIVNYGLLSNKTTFEIPDGIRSVQSGAFSGIGAYNDALVKLVAPESIETFWGIYYTNFGLGIWKASEAGSTFIGSSTNQVNIVFKKSVKQITGNSVFFTNYNYIFEHTDEDEITIDFSSPKTSVAINIYTDSTYVRNYDWASKNITPTFYSLSEYTGELE